MKTVKGLLVICLLIVLGLSMTGVIAVVPFGAQLSNEASSTAPEDDPENHTAIAGNVTEMTIHGYTRTQSWQGYYGNVSGTIQLADSDDEVMYNWSLASPEGEVYAVNNSGVSWTNVQCFNFTANGTLGGDQTGTRGGTAQAGHNLSTIEASYNINWDDVDGLNETFSIDGSHESGGGFTHDEFHTNNLNFTTGECLSTHIFDSSGAAADNNFQEVLLYDPDNDLVIFTSILDEEDVAGFDGSNHDFEMLVLEDGHGTDVSSTLYHFYVELE